MLKSNKVDLSSKARQALEIEAALRRMTLKDLASELILGHVSDKTLSIIGTESPKVHKPTKAEATDSKPKRRKLADDPDAMNRIKELWNSSPRPSVSAIAKEINWPRTTIQDSIKKMIEAGVLSP